MKHIVCLLLLLCLAFSNYAQVVESSCEANDSIKNAYLEDAKLIALRKIVDQQLPALDSVVISTTHTDSILDALMAVYNTELQARDTVVEMLNLHTFPDIHVTSLIVNVDSNSYWVKNLRNNADSSGNDTFDYLIEEYDLYVESYNDNFNHFDYHTIIIESRVGLNVFALRALFNDINGVLGTDLNGYIGDGDDITAEIHSDYIELVYSHGWEDCLSGCMYHRYWKFKVYFDCSVEFVSSYGAPLETATIPELNSSNVQVYPNPFSDNLNIEGIEGPFSYKIYNIKGQVLLSGNSNNSSTNDLSNLSQGMYWLEIQWDGGIYRKKIMKE